MEPAQLQPYRLAPDENTPQHPCADVRWYAADLALLNYLLQDLRALVRRCAGGELELAPYQTLTWDVHGLARRTVICDPASLLQPLDVMMVGFLGDRRSTEQARTVDAAELDVIGEFRSYPGIMSYSSIELIGNQWANLVVHRQASDRDDWRHSDVHIQAAEQLAPRVYHSVRIHNGCIRGGPIGTDTVVIETTKYWDYDCEPTWHAMRVLPGGATETVDRPAGDH